jgi:hypothetical protein
MLKSREQLCWLSSSKVIWFAPWFSTYFYQFLEWSLESDGNLIFIYSSVKWNREFTRWNCYEKHFIIKHMQNMFYNTWNIAKELIRDFCFSIWIVCFDLPQVHWFFSWWCWATNESIGSKLHPIYSVIYSQQFQFFNNNFDLWQYYLLDLFLVGLEFELRALDLKCWLFISTLITLTQLFLILFQSNKNISICFWLLFYLWKMCRVCFWLFICFTIF